MLFIDREYITESDTRCFFYNFSRPLTLWRLYKIIGKERPQLLHLQYPTRIFYRLVWIGVVSAIRLRYRSLKIITTIHEIEPYFNPYWFYHLGYWLRLMILIAVSDGLISTHRAEWLRLRRICKLTFIVPLANTLTGQLAAIQSSSPTSVDLPEKPFMLFFGNINCGKNLQALIQAISDERLSHTLFLVCHGNLERELMSELEQLILKLGIGDRVVFHYQLALKDIIMLYNHAAFITLPYSGGITLRSSVLQSVIAWNKRFIAEIGDATPLWIKRRAEETYTAKTTGRELADLLLKMFTRNRMEKIPHSAALEAYFSWESIAAKHESIYGKLLSEGT